MAILDLLKLPVKVTLSAVDATLALGQLAAAEGPIRRPDGYADRVMLIIGRGGLVERVAVVLSDPRGPMRLVNALADALDRERPLGAALAPGGTLDRLLTSDGTLFHLFEDGGTLDRVLAAGGPVDRLLEDTGALNRLVAPDGPLERLLEEGGALDRLTRHGGTLDRLLDENGLLDRLLSDDGFVERLIADGGTLDRLVQLGDTLEHLQPRIAEILTIIPELHDSVITLNRSVGPIGELANRLPRGRRRGTLEL